MIKSRRMRWSGHVAHMGEKGNAYRILLGYLEGNKPLRRPRLRWKHNIKMDIRAIACGRMEWIHLAAQDRDQWRDVGNTVMNLRVLSNVGKFLSS
jgi:hypothetical protein